MTSYFNGSVPLYVSDSQIENLIIDVTNLQMEITTLEEQVNDNTMNITTLNNEITSFDNALSGQMIQYYKATDTTNDVTLTPGNTFVLITGYTGISLGLPGNFVVSSPGILQYQGTNTAFFLINYSISGYIDSGTFPIGFCLQKNSALLDSSQQIQTMTLTVNDFKSVSGFAIASLSTNDTISLRARVIDASPNVISIGKVCITITKIPSA